MPTRTDGSGEHKGQGPRRRGELVVPPERIVREEKPERERAPITVVVNVAAADANSFRASQGRIAAEMVRAIDRAGRNR
jgi:hypothetical protein